MTAQPTLWDSERFERSENAIPIEAKFDADEAHGLERRAVMVAIKSVAMRHFRHVDQNLVRPLIPNWVDSKVVGSTYRMLVAAKLITSEDCPANRSDDHKGGNAGRWQPTYRWIGDL